MKFDFSFDVTLDLEFIFEDQDYERYLKSYEYCDSQLDDVKKAEFWARRKTVIIHDMITMYCQTDASEFCDDEAQINVLVNDRGNKKKFVVNPYKHVQEIFFCRDCILDFLVNGSEEYHDESSRDTLILCEKCGSFDSKHCCSF